MLLYLLCILDSSRYILHEYNIKKPKTALADKLMNIRCNNAYGTERDRTFIECKVLEPASNKI